MSHTADSIAAEEALSAGVGDELLELGAKVELYLF